ncbi:hypothetical protein XENOCAPTIV_003956 [Xenoophorus captivus]|uniref:Uncharacterized protein n=1 Tax=Xenoophorus captivus TaxID=1517983 RepID=A0ABV0R6R0_9TELE
MLLHRTCLWIMCGADCKPSLNINRSFHSPHSCQMTKSGCRWEAAAASGSVWLKLCMQLSLSESSAGSDSQSQTDFLSAFVRSLTRGQVPPLGDVHSQNETERRGNVPLGQRFSDSSSSWVVLGTVMDVEVVREGYQSEVMLSIAEEFPAELCFTLVFHGRQGNLDLVADSPEEAQAWIQGVRKLIHKAQTMDEQERQDQWVQDWFQKADKNKDGKMNFKEVKKLLKMMNVEMNEDHALHLFTRDEVWKVFQDYSGDGEMLTLEELENFLRLEQGEGDQSSQHALELIQCYELSETGTCMVHAVDYTFCLNIPIYPHIFMQ